VRGRSEEGKETKKKEEKETRLAAFISQAQSVNFLVKDELMKSGKSTSKSNQKQSLSSRSTTTLRKMSPPTLSDRAWITDKTYKLTLTLQAILA
jgi:hypothetical protein